MTTLYQLTETSEFMMSFVLVTEKDNVIIIDGGRPLDMPLLKQYVGGRRVAAWILTHAHMDHISGFIGEMERDGCADFAPEAVYYNFPPYGEWRALAENRDPRVPNPEYLIDELDGMLPAFNAVLPRFSDRAHVARQGERITVDEVSIDFLYTWHDGLFANPMNDSSLVFKVTTPRKTALFLGDLGPEGGDMLFAESRHLLKSDIVQMAHHGHMNCGMEVYEAIAPDACMWCCADWLYNEPEIPVYFPPLETRVAQRRVRLYGTAVTRRWMDSLGVKTHYVTKDGTNTILL